MTGWPAIEVAVDTGAALGECPVWSPAEQVLYWVDIDGRRVHRHDPVTGLDEHRDVEGRPGSIALTADPGRLLVAVEHEVVELDWPSRTVTPFAVLEDPARGNRANDGGVDPAGRFVVGTMWPDTGAGRTTGGLYRVTGDGRVETLERDLGVPNGLAFDADRGRMYTADTPTRTVLVADYDPDTGHRGTPRVFFDYGDLPGKPDGACLDADGCYWSACVRGGALIRIDPDGRLDRRIELPVGAPTMPAFGGPDLTRLYVTSIDDRDRNPATAGVTPGSVLVLEPGVSGRPEPVFAAS